MKLYLVSIISTGLLASIAQAQRSLEQTFRDDNYKNIAFVCNVGGATHYNWVLSILDELGIRGHNTTFITNDNDTRFGHPYPNIKMVSYGPGPVVDPSMVTDSTSTKGVKPGDLMKKALKMVYYRMERDYPFVRDYFIENNIDLAICDHVAPACMDVARNLSIPYVITSAIDMFDEGTPYINGKLTSLNDYTTEFQSFTTRFINRIISPLRMLYHIYPDVQELKKKRADLGITDLRLEHKEALQIIDNYFGFAAPRPRGTYTEYVGPIVPTKYQPLTEELQTYLDNRQNIAYIAFGQLATPSEKDITLILTAILENYESGALDGFIWSSIRAVGNFPDSITTTSGTTYKIQDLFNGVYADILFMKWAPQTAVLLHPTTSTFVSHGGLGSWYEAMHTGKRMIMFPFFGDQPGNSLIIERNNLGGVFRLEQTPEEAAALVKRVVIDEDGVITKNVKRYQAITQIRSGRGVVYAADLIEEVGYGNVNGKIPHRESADRRMSFIKSHNYDLYAAVLVILYVSYRIIAFIVKSLFKLFQQSSNQKIKQL